MTTARSVGVVSQFDSSFRTALGNASLEAVDLETLERLEQSPEVDYFLDPAAPKILYTLVQSHMNSRPNSRIFDDQYGLVCVRILIRLVQVIVCQNSDTLSYVRESMGGAAANTSILAFLSGHTVDVIQRQMGQSHDNNSLKTISNILGKSKDLFSRDHISKLLGLLWQDRKSFFILFKNGSLQGIVLLLYMVWVQISGIMSEMDEFLMARLRDLLFRCYLVTDAQERHTIRLLCIQMYHLYNGHEDESKPFDLEDSRAMVHAYNQCIMFSTDPDPLGGMKLDMYRYLLEFISDVTVLPMQEELPLVIRAAIERLWLAFDTEKIEPLITPDDPRSQTMYYFGDLSYALS
ncbi:hypothetical protein FRC09_000516 [Ceratobasidium sp. 395]|nr:hypothetical protein FRC09_000516 [Ceratobasidium sp. 395]